MKKSLSDKITVLAILAALGWFVPLLAQVPLGSKIPPRLTVHISASASCLQSSLFRLLAAQLIGGASIPTAFFLYSMVTMVPPEREQVEKQVRALSKLGRGLSAVRTPKEAAQIIADTADSVCGWDAFVLDLCSPDHASAHTILCVDTIRDRRTEAAVDPSPAALSPIARQVIEHGPQLVLRPAGAPFPSDTLPFGDTTRASASLMFVPVRQNANVIGVLSIQSYSTNAYSEEDLRNLQSLADHCAGALERLRAEAALQEANERLRMALAASRMATWTTELTGRRLFIGSPELEAIVGLKPGEFPETEQALFEFIHPEDRKPVRHAFSSAIDAKRDYEVEFRFLPRNRPLGWMLGRGRAYYDAAGQPIRLAGVAIDITARKEAEQEISRLNAELECRVRERTAQLEATNRELESFTYSVSHDLRAPLRSIRGFSEVLLERYSGQLDPLGQEYLRRASESCQRMDRLIDDLLKLSRAGRSDLQWQTVSLTALATSIAAELRNAEPHRELELIIGPDLHAQGDEHLLRIALDNLLRNAWKFTGRCPRARIEFGLASGHEPAFFVRDNGVGFDPAYAGKLFGVFQRLHSAADFPGTGVGLATVQRIIQRHGGRVWATGVVNVGATFYFTLPENRRSTSEATPPGTDC